MLEKQVCLREDECVQHGICFEAKYFLHVFIHMFYRVIFLDEKVFLMQRIICLDNMQYCN